MTDDEWRAAYLAHAHQIEREDNLYQTRTNFDLTANGGLIVLYGVVSNGNPANVSPYAKLFLPILVCVIGFAASYVFERLINRSYQQTKALKQSYRDTGVASWAAAKKLPKPFLDLTTYRDYPFAEVTMYLFVFWFLLAIATIILIFSGTSLGNMHV